MGGCVTQLLWMMHALKDYGLNYRKFQVLIDNINSINLTKNLVYHSRTKYIKVKHHFIRDHIENEDIVLKHIESKSNIDDIFIKPLTEDEFNTLRKRLSLCILE